MSQYEFDVIVVGAGHAGIEAAMATARRGLKTALFTISLDSVANMPCNPSVGGTGKGHLVFEIDILGGEMGYQADCAMMQSRTLNTGKGAAVQSKRVQADRRVYSHNMKHAIELQDNLSLIQGEISEILIESANGEKRVCGVISMPGGEYTAKAVILSTGTYLGGLTHVGRVQRRSGPDSLLPAEFLTTSLINAGIKTMRFKTGTPPRILRSSIDFDALERQDGEEHITPFSVRSDKDKLNSKIQTPCYIVYTNDETHKTIRDNLDKSPLFSGQIHGTGPRYCPSIEDKVVRFADKERHQLFAEPVGDNNEEIYLQGFSSSMPADVQYKMLRSLKGFENAQIMRYAYAIEYDCIDPLTLRPSLESKLCEGLFCAGQFNGSSGYEEAAVQGFMAGVNASLKIMGREPVVLDRSQAYIGVLIDDLVTKESHEPYRMMTSRAEYRLLLRQDNADLRLTEIGHEIGLISDGRYEKLLLKKNLIDTEIERMNSVHVGDNKRTNDFLRAHESTELNTGATLADLIRRPELDYFMLTDIDVNRPSLSEDIQEQVNIEIKYKGYIDRQLQQVRQFTKLEVKKIPSDIDYDQVGSLRLEARQKLKIVRPENIGQAARISGVSPADISMLLVYLK